MAPLRLRHPKGVATLQIDPDTATVQDLLQAIFAASEIPPSAQDRTPPLPLVSARLTHLARHSQSRLSAEAHHRRYTRTAVFEPWHLARRPVDCDTEGRLRPGASLCTSSGGPEIAC